MPIRKRKSTIPKKRKPGQRKAKKVKQNIQSIIRKRRKPGQRRAKKVTRNVKRKSGR